MGKDLINNRLSDAIKASKLSIGEICEQGMFTRQGLRKWIQRRSYPTGIYLKSLCKVLKSTKENLGLNDPENYIVKVIS